MGIRSMRTCALVIALFAMAITVPLSTVLDFPGGESAPPPETVLRMGFMNKIDSFNPYVGLGDSSHIFYGLVYDCLQGVGNDLEPVPNLALSWYPVPTDDPDPKMEGMPYGSVWQYNLTPNAYWTDGVPFTADDVIFNTYVKEASRILGISSFVLHPSSALSLHLERVLIAAL